MPSQKPPISSFSDPVQQARQPLFVATAEARLKSTSIAFAPFFAILGGWLSLAEAGFFSESAAWTKLAALTITGSALYKAYQYGRAHRAPIDQQQILRAVEKATALPHRPLQTLQDSRAQGQPLFWEAHRKNLRHALQSVKFRSPRLRFPSSIKAFRASLWPSLAATILVCTVGFLIGSPQAQKNLTQSLRINAQELWPQSQMTAWITPPAYTHEPPLSLNGFSGSLQVPEGSRITVHISGGVFPPVLQEEKARFHLTQEEPDQQNHLRFSFDQPLTQSGILSIRQDGHWLGRWPLTQLVDAPPQVAFDGTPTTSDRDVLKIGFTASDDYGLTALSAEVQPTSLSADLDAAGLNEPLILPFAVPQTAKNKTVSGFRFFDLTSSPWAGQDVTATLTATDGKGQKAESTPLTFRLPERQFKTPMAQALSGLRKQLLHKGVSAAPLLFQALGVLASDVELAPENFYDPTGLMGLYVARERARSLSDSKDLKPLFQLMWDLAVHFDDNGASGNTLDDLRRAEQALEDALANNASPEELRQKMQDLAQALKRHLEALQKQAPPQQQSADAPPSQNSITPEELAQAFDSLANMIENGAKDQAREMLSQLQQMMENLQSEGNSSPSEEQQAQTEALQKLEKLMHDQQQLMAETQKAPSDNTQSQAGSQEDLTHQLEQLNKSLEESQKQGNSNLSDGQKAMEKAEESLRQNQRDGGVMNQSRALQNLQQAARDLRKKINQSGQNQTSAEAGRAGGRKRVDIPGAGSPDKAQAILEELRKRASDPTRSAPEKDYLQRLLKIF